MWFLYPSPCCEFSFIPLTLALQSNLDEEADGRRSCVAESLGPGINGLAKFEGHPYADQGVLAGSGAPIFFNFGFCHGTRLHALTHITHHRRAGKFLLNYKFPILSSRWRVSKNEKGWHLAYI
jgi:hypothetical protein